MWRQDIANQQYYSHPSLNVPRSFQESEEFEKKLEAVGISPLNIRFVPANASWSKVRPIVHGCVSEIGRRVILNVHAAWIRTKRGALVRKSKSGKKVYKKR